MTKSLKYFLIYTTLMMCVIKGVDSVTVGSCAAYSLDGSQCQKCIDNYHNFDGRCYVDILGCKVYNFGNICLECEKDYILVNNYCCDKTCISQMYRESNSSLSNGDIGTQESERIQEILTMVKEEIFPTLQVRVSSISLQKYQDVIRFYVLYEYLNNTNTWRRIIYDYHVMQRQYILVDDSNLNSQFNFQLTPYQTITDLQKVKSVLTQFNNLFLQVDPSLTIIKQAQVNKIKQYQVLVHNQNSLKVFYHSTINNQTVVLYDITLAPQYFKIILMGQYLNQSFNTFKFLQLSKGILDKNLTYTNTTIKAIQVYNSSSLNEPLKVQIYSQGQIVVIKTLFEVFYSSVQTISEIKLVSSKIQNKSVSVITWVQYIQDQNIQIQKVFQLILSGYNSSKDIPSDYVVDKSLLNEIQFEFKIQKWKIFTKYNFHINTKTSSIQTKVIKIEYLNEYRVERLSKVENIIKPVLTTVSNLVNNFTVNQSLGCYERTIQGWSSINTSMTQRVSIKNIIQWFTLRTQYEVVGSKANITKLLQTVNNTHINYTIVAQNFTHYMKTIINNNTIDSTPKILSIQYMQKQQKDFITNYLKSTLNATHHFKDNSTIGVKVYYSYNSKWTLFTNFTYSYANSLQNKFRDIYRKSRNTTGIYHSYDDRNLLDSYIINSTYSTVPTDFIVQYHPCPTSPYTQYTWIWNYNRAGNGCYQMKFLQINQNGTKKMIMNGYNSIVYGEFCNYTRRFTSNSTLTQILPKNSFSSTGLFTKTYFRALSSMQTYSFNISQMNSTFQSYMNSKYNNSEIYKLYQSFKSQELYSLQLFNRFTPYNRWDKYRTDSNNVSYQLISYLPSGYFKNKTIPNYSGSFNREYHHICVGLNRSALFDEKYWRNSFNNQSQWVKPNVTDWYALLMGRDKVYNTGFVENISQLDSINYNSQQQQSLNILNQSLKLMQSSLIQSNSSSITNISSYSIRQRVVIDYQLYRVYMMRVNVSVNKTIDMIVLNRKYNQSIQLISYMSLNIKQLQMISMQKSITYKLIDNNEQYSYLKDIIPSDYLLYFLSKYQQIDYKLDQLIKSKISQSLPLVNQTNSTDITVNKLFYSSQSLNNQTVIVKIIYSVNDNNNINTNDSRLYYLGSCLMKYNLTKDTVTNLTKDTVTNTTMGLYWIYLLQSKLINHSSNNSNSKDDSYQFYTTNTVQSYVTNQIITNYTVPYSFNPYNTTTTNNTTTNLTNNISNSTTSTNTISNNSYFNVTFGQNVSEVIEKFNNLTSQTGKLLQDGELVQVKYYPSINLLNPNQINTNSQYKQISTDLVVSNKILNLIQTKYKQKIHQQNITSTILMIQKLSDSQQFISYSILIQSTLKYFNITTLSTQSIVYLLRFTYLTYKQYFISMGYSILSYESILKDINDQSVLKFDIKDQSVLQFEPMKRVSSLKYLSSFIYEVINLVNEYLVKNNINERVVIVRELFYRNYISGGFYKIQMGVKSGDTLIGYLIQKNYQYRVLNVKLIPMANTNANTTTNINTNETLTVVNNESNNSVNNESNNSVNNETIISINASDITNSQSVTQTNSTNQSVDVNDSSTNTNSNANSTIINANISQTVNSESNTSTLYSTNTSIQTTNTNNVDTVNNNSQQTTSSNNKQTNTTQSTHLSKYSSVLQSQIFTVQTTNMYMIYLREIITKLKLQYYQYLSNKSLTTYSITESIDGQFYSITYQLHSATTNTNIYRSDIIIYRCNSTCSTYQGNNNSLHILSFIKSTINNNEVIDMKDLTNTISLSANSIQTQESINVITQSFYYSNNSANTSTQSSYYIPSNEQQSLLSIFQTIYNQQSITTVDPLLLNYQKYLHFLKQYLSTIVYSNSCKIIDENLMNQQTKSIIIFVTQRYSLIFNQSILLMMVQNNNKINNQTNYTLYFVTQQKLNLIYSSWIIYLVNVTSTQIYTKNYNIQVNSITQWTRNGQLITQQARDSQLTTNNNNISSLLQIQYNKQQTDIAFGYIPVNNIDSLNLQQDFIQIINQLNNKYSVLITNKTITKAQKLQLKNGTTTYKLYFTHPITLQQVKVIAVYRKDQQRVQILNKLYIPNQNYRPVQQAQLNATDILNSTVSMIQQLHSKQISSPFINVTNLQVTTQSSSLQRQIQRYRLSLQLPSGKTYTSIVDYNPSLKSLTQVSFNQIIQLPKDSMYRLNVYEKEHSEGYVKVQQTNWNNDNLYQIVINKLKTLDANYLRTVLVYKKSQGFSFIYKVIYQVHDNITQNQQLIQLSTQKKLYQIFILIQPSQQKVQSFKPSYKLNLTQGYVPIKQWQMSQQQLMTLINEFRSMYNLSANSQMLVNSTMKKQFIDGMLIKILLYIRAQDNITRTYQILAFRQSLSNKFTLWTVTSLLPNFQSPCSINQTCTQCKNQINYQLHTNNICALKINHCQTYKIDITKNILLCQQCLIGYQLFDNKCIQKTFHPQLWK